MIFVYQNKAIHYEFFETDSTCPTIVLLHGWGGNCKSFTPIYSAFEGFNILSLDFWGFGESDEPSSDFTLFSYTDATFELISHLHLSDCILLGHSFGGRVAIVLAANHSDIVKGLVLIDAAGLKPRFSAKRAYKIGCYKCNKFLVKHRLRNAACLEKYGSSDYKKLSSNVRPVFNAIINQGLSEFAQQIHCKTLIVWGQNDKDTPLYMAKRLHRYVRNSNLCVVKNAGHFVYLDSSNIVIKCIKEFLNGFY